MSKITIPLTFNTKTADRLSSLTTAASAECSRTQFTEKSMADIALPSVEIFENFQDVVELSDIATGKMDNKDNPLRYSRFKEGDFEKGDTFLK